MLRILVLLLAGSAALSIPRAVAQTVIVDIIPRSLNLEHGQNSEPNIAVNPFDPTKIVVSAFGSGSTNPIFMSKDHGATWKVLQKVPASDISVGWGSPYDAFMTLLSPSGSAISTLRLHDPTVISAFRALRRSTYRPGGNGPDQPWTEGSFVEGVSRTYVAFNDLSQASGRTASVRLSLDGGVTWSNTVIEHTTPGDGADGAAVRVAANGEIVYAAFQRFNAQSNGDEIGDIVVVRDDAGGVNHFANLGSSGEGVVVASSQLLPQRQLGQERLGSDLSIAVDPFDPTHVVVAYATISSGDIGVVLQESTDSGAHWSQLIRTGADSALPAVAIASNGAIGLLYTRYDGANLETHLVQSSNGFTTKADLLLAKFADASLTSDFDPFIGDYEDLVAVGDTFYGTFSASNNTAAFPQPPTFLRDATLLGGRVPYSIDPFFFKTPALP